MKRHARKLAFGLGLLALVAVVLVVVLIYQFLRPTPPPPGGPSTPPSTPSDRPEAQPADCPDVLVLSIPGTWESKPNDDPHHPTANSRSLMLRVTKALQRNYD